MKIDPIATLTLALGIGANTALFSVVNGVLLRPLPYPNPGQLVALYGKAPGYDRAPISYPNFLDWQQNARAFSAIALYHNQDYNFVGTGDAERVSGYMISAGFFDVLGVNPVLGRTFQADDDRLGAERVVILGGGFWQRQFGAAPDIVGKSIDLSGASYTIVGVIPASFEFYGRDRDVYTPIGQWNEPSFRDRRVVWSSGMVGRLRPGVALAQARAEMEGIARNLAATYPDADTGISAVIISLKDDVIGDVRPLLVLLMGAVGCLLLIACANVANLLLARSLIRSREFAIRLALGASRGRVIRQLLTESVLLAGLGGAVGLPFAFWGTNAVLRIVPAALPRSSEVSIDFRVLFFTLSVSLACGILFGLAPALKTTRVDLQDALRQGGRGSAGAPRHLQELLVAVAVAMAFVLLVGAGLMIRSLAALWRVDPGFNPSHALTFSLSLPGSTAASAADTRARLRLFDSRMLSIPGVDAVSVTLGSRPMQHDSTEAFWIEGRPKPSNINDMNQAMFYLAEPGFAQAMGIPVERGRFIGPHDDEHARAVIVIDDVFARTYFPADDPVGKHVHLATFNVEAEIVGVAGHVKQTGLDGGGTSAIEAQFYYPFMQLSDEVIRSTATGVAVVLRTRGDPRTVASDVRRAVADVDRRAVVYNVVTLDDVVAKSLAARRFSMFLMGAFGSLALLLASIGIYGVISCLVGQRTREIGVRVALGAERRDVFRLILRDGARVALIGIAAGLAAALGLTRFMIHQLFATRPHDPATYAGVALLLLAVAVAACYVPARRAIRVDPIVVLHE